MNKPMLVLAIAAVGAVSLTTGIVSAGPTRGAPTMGDCGCRLMCSTRP